MSMQQLLVCWLHGKTLKQALGDNINSAVVSFCREAVLFLEVYTKYIKSIP